MVVGYACLPTLPVPRLPQHPTCPAFGHHITAKPVTNVLARLALLRRAQWFPEAASRKIALSSSGVRKESLQPSVLFLEILKPLRLVRSQPAVFPLPSVVRMLRHATLCRPPREPSSPESHSNLSLAELPYGLLDR